MNLRRSVWLVLLVALLGACNTLSESETLLEPQVGLTNINVVNKGGNSTWMGTQQGLKKWTPTGGGNAVAQVITRGTYTVGAYGRGGVWQGCDSVRKEDPRHYCTVKIVPGTGRQATRAPTVTFLGTKGTVTFHSPEYITFVSLSVIGKGVNSGHERDVPVSLPEGTYNLSGTGYDSFRNLYFTLSSPTTFTVARGENKTVYISLTPN